MLNRDFVMTGWLFKKLPAMQNAAALGIAGCKHKPAYPSKGDRRRAHRAGFQRDIEVIFGDTLGARPFALLADDADLGMGGGVGQDDSAVSCAGDDLTVPGIDQNRTDRHFARQSGLFRLFHRGPHMAMVLLCKHKALNNGK